MDSLAIVNGVLHWRLFVRVEPGNDRTSSASTDVGGVVHVE